MIDPFVLQGTSHREVLQMTTKHRISDRTIAMHCCRAYALLLLCAATAIASPAQTFTSLFSFDYGTRGSYPGFGGLVQATNGDLYGTTYQGGAKGGGGYGTIFKITPSGRLTTVHRFDSTDGGPLAGLIQATDGNLYGTTSGIFGLGTVFKITLGGKLTTLHSFDGTDGANPSSGLVQGTDGNFYGTTTRGGANFDGTIFKITPSGRLTTLHSFDSLSVGSAGLIQATNGYFYGTTDQGGANSQGSVFKMSPSGTLTTLYSFCSQNNCPDGQYPSAALVQATDGNLYGTTSSGGLQNCPNYSCGTVFKITPSGTLTTLYSFCSQKNCPDSAYPSAALVQATDGNLYGETGGFYGVGTIFKITLGGKLTTLYTFCSQKNCNDGTYPSAALIQDTNGTFYGTTDDGGTYNLGTIFSLSVNLGPFVELQETSGKVGAAVKILGADLTGATSVTFHGTAAVFKVVSASFIKTTVPQGATTGTVDVKTPRGTLKSNVVFRVTK
jgi:uncharacterized repeat protein (TIGR03803 family)